MECASSKDEELLANASSLTYNSSDCIDGEDELRYPELRSSLLKYLDMRFIE